jgi:hypothetical protein
MTLHVVCLKFLLYLYIIIPPKSVGRRGIETVAVVGEWGIGIEEVVNPEG